MSDDVDAKWVAEKGIVAPLEAMGSARCRQRIDIRQNIPRVERTEVELHRNGVQVPTRVEIVAVEPWRVGHQPGLPQHCQTRKIQEVRPGEDLRLGLKQAEV